MGPEFIGRRRWWWWRWQEDGNARVMRERGQREKTGVKHTCNNRNAQSAENWTGSNSSCHIAPHVIVMRNPTALFDIPWRPSCLSFRGIENAHRWSCCCCCCYFGVRICCIWVHSISFDLLLLRLCCSSWSASFVFFRAPQLEICKRDMVRTQRLWQTHYPQKKKQKTKKKTPTNLNLNLSFFHTQSQPRSLTLPTHNLKLNHSFFHTLTQSQSLFLKFGEAHEKLLERGDVPLLNNYPMELGSEMKWINIKLPRSVSFYELEEKMQLLKEVERVLNRLIHFRVKVFALKMIRIIVDYGICI